MPLLVHRPSSTVRFTRTTSAKARRPLFAPRTARTRSAAPQSPQPARTSTAVLLGTLLTTAAHRTTPSVRMRRQSAALRLDAQRWSAAQSSHQLLQSREVARSSAAHRAVQMRRHSPAQTQLLVSARQWRSTARATRTTSVAPLPPSSARPIRAHPPSAALWRRSRQLSSPDRPVWTGRAQSTAPPMPTTSRQDGA